MAEGAALEMPCRGNSTVGSNPTPSAIYPQHGEAMLTVGEKVSSFVFVRSAVGVSRSIQFMNMTSPVGEKGPYARRRPKLAREAYSLYVERASEGANEADGPFSTTGKGWPC